MTTEETPSAEPSEADVLRLDQFLKLCAVVDSGGQAKFVIQKGEVKVNGQVETRRRRKLVHGDLVEFAGQALQVHDTQQADPPGE